MIVHLIGCPCSKCDDMLIVQTALDERPPVVLMHSLTNAVGASQNLLPAPQRIPLRRICRTAALRCQQQHQEGPGGA